MSYSLFTGQEQSIQNKQKIKIDIPNEKLIIPIQQVQKSFITGRIQALVLVHQRLNSMKLCLFF